LSRVDRVGQWGAANVPRFLVFLPAIYDLILKNIVDENKTMATEFKI
jgi:hypothetical protein